MEDRRILILFLGVFLSLPLSTLGYSAQTTHPALADESVDFFKKSYTLEISGEEKSWIVEGSVDEDFSVFRVLNHFYDPVYNRGLEEFRGISSKIWATDTKYQATYLNPLGEAAGAYAPLYSSWTDYSWERSIYEYVHGSKKRGLLGLGHTLHLVHDLTVPPHTRNDSHPPAFDFGSPYEEWTSRFTPNNTDVISELSERSPVLLGKIEDYFDSVARYTNTNFFSKDTIFSGEYHTPLHSLVGVGILSGGEMQSFGISNTGGVSYKLFELQEYKDKNTGRLIKDYFINKDRVEEPVLSDYWNILSKQAVLNGAGVIKLFFDEVEKEKETLALYYKNQSWLDKLLPKMFTREYKKGDLTPFENLAAVSTLFEEFKLEDIQKEVIIEEEKFSLPLAEEMIIPVNKIKGMSPPLGIPDLGGAAAVTEDSPPALPTGAI